MPPHLHYVEPYFGGGAVLLEKDPEGVSEVVSDINGELTAFWLVLQDDRLFAMFQRAVEAIPFSEWEWESAQHKCRWPEVEAALRFFVRCRQSRAGQFKEFATLSRARTRRGMNEQASAWLTAIEGLPAVHARLKRVVILNRDALDVTLQQDGPKTLFYYDPTYLHVDEDGTPIRAATDVYEYEMTRGQHAQLLDLLPDIQGKFLLSGYRSKLYERYRKKHGWRREEFEIPNNASGSKSKRRMTECLWLNY